MWLHLGILGPQRVELEGEGAAPRPPGKLVANEFSLLDVSDLVFVDPVGTGFSRMVEGEKVKEYHDYKRDLESVGEFIRMWVSRYGRWASPKYLIGESYGTTRASGLAGHLLDRYGLYLNGLMLVSMRARLRRLPRSTCSNDLPPVLFLPTYAATAWYHKRLPKDLQKKPLRKLLDEVEEFAATDYAARSSSAHGCPRVGARQSWPRSRATRAFHRNTSSRPTCASRSSASARSCCAATARPSAASTAASPASTATRRASASSSIRDSRRSSAPMPPR